MNWRTCQVGDRRSTYCTRSRLTTPDTVQASFSHAMVSVSSSSPSQVVHRAVCPSAGKAV